MVHCQLKSYQYPVSEWRVSMVGDMFMHGPLPTQILSIPSTGMNVKKPLMLVLPSQPGDYPLFIFFHGYLLLNSFYTQLLQHIASHGYITIAPQMYTTAGADATPEIADAVAITDWLTAGLRHFLPEQVRPDFQKVAVGGHSRGGKVAFGAALSGGGSGSGSGYSAVVGVDPVDGMSPGNQTPPPILSYKPHSFELNNNVPTLVIGSGLGPVKRNPFFPPCAPAGVNHVDFFRECRAPSYHFVAADYGHLDYLDDKTGGVRGKTSYCLCKNGTAREPMRRFTAGIIVAFLNAFLTHDKHDLHDIFANPSRAPLKLDPPDRYVSVSLLT